MERFVKENQIYSWSAKLGGNELENHTVLFVGMISTPAKQAPAQLPSFSLEGESVRIRQFEVDWTAMPWQRTHMTLVDRQCYLEDRISEELNNHCAALIDQMMRCTLNSASGNSRVWGRQQRAEGIFTRYLGEKCHIFDEIYKLWIHDSLNCNS